MVGRGLNPPFSGNSRIATGVPNTAEGPLPPRRQRRNPRHAGEKSVLLRSSLWAAKHRRPAISELAAQESGRELPKRDACGATKAAHRSDREGRTPTSESVSDSEARSGRTQAAFFSVSSGFASDLPSRLRVRPVLEASTVRPGRAAAGEDSAASFSRSYAAKAGPKSSPLACCPISSQASAMPSTTACRTPSRSQWKKFMLCLSKCCGLVPVAICAATISAALRVSTAGDVGVEGLSAVDLPQQPGETLPAASDPDCQSWQDRLPSRKVS